MRRGIAFALAALGLALLAPPASADHHFMKIREVYPGSMGAGFNDAFVELQMYSSGQNLVSGHHVSFYASTGINTPVAEFTSNPPNGQNQRTILVGDSAVTDADLAYNVSDVVDAAGGAVCFESTEGFGEIDCVAWGTFTNTATLAVGTPAAVIPAGQSLTRSIAPGCATLLESGDDTDDSATDFALSAPSPRPNSQAPTEQACGPGGGGGGDNNPPNTEITKGPKKKIEKPKTKFKFRSSEPNSTFQCKLDKGAFKRCDSPKKVKGLDDGKHKFFVRATDNAGNTDPTPAKLKFKVVEKG